jgi:hypothetical protein
LSIPAPRLATRLRRKEPWYPNLSLFARKLTIFGYWRILLQKSAVTDDVVQRIHLDDGPCPVTPTLVMQFLILRFGEHRRFIERPLCATSGPSQLRIGTAPETTLSLAATFSR